MLILAFKPVRTVYCGAFSRCHGDARPITATSAESRHVKIDIKRPVLKPTNYGVFTWYPPCKSDVMFYGR